MRSSFQTHATSEYDVEDNSQSDRRANTLEMLKTYVNAGIEWKPHSVKTTNTMSQSPHRTPANLKNQTYLTPTLETTRLKFLVFSKIYCSWTQIREQSAILTRSVPALSALRHLAGVACADTYVVSENLWTRQILTYLSIVSIMLAMFLIMHTNGIACANYCMCIVFRRTYSSPSALPSAANSAGTDADMHEEEICVDCACVECACGGLERGCREDTLAHYTLFCILHFVLCLLADQEFFCFCSA